MGLETGNSQGQEAADARLEGEIASAYTAFISARTPKARRQAFDQARALQEQRSTESARRLAAGAGSRSR